MSLVRYDDDALATKLKAHAELGLEDQREEGRRTEKRRVVYLGMAFQKDWLRRTGDGGGGVALLVSPGRESRSRKKQEVECPRKGKEKRRGRRRSSRVGGEREARVHTLAVGGPELDQPLSCAVYNECVLRACVVLWSAWSSMYASESASRGLGSGFNRTAARTDWTAARRKK